VSAAGVSQRQRAYAAWIAVCVIWGTTYLGIRVSIETMPPFIMAGLRWVIAGGLLVVVLGLKGTPLPPLRVWPSVAMMGFLLLVLGNGGVVWAEQYVTSGLAAVVIATSPFWMVGFEALLGRERLTGRVLAGLAVGFIGIVLLVWPELQQGGAAGTRFLAGVVALQIACAGWAAGSFWSKRHTQQADVFAVAALQMLLAGVMLLGLGTAIGEWPSLHFSTRSASAFVYLIVVGSIGGFVAYIYALKHLPIAIVSLYAYINPVIAVVLGMLLLNERFDGRMALGAVVVLSAVAIVRGAAGEGAGGRARREAA
jgi:drug/metabolite transporter (DMT)-like permease